MLPNHTKLSTSGYHCVDLLQRGFVAGSIITVDPQDAAELGKPWTRRYIYNQKSCGRCKGPVRTWDMAGRTVYCCETCQPLNPHKAAGGKGTGGAGSQAAGARGAKKGRGAGGSGSAGAGNGNGKVIGESESDEEREQGEGEEEEEEEEVQEEVQIAPARRAAMAAARTGRVFVSHCAPDDPADVEPAKLTVKLLKERLIALNLDTRGAKPQLVARLEAALRWQQPGHDHDPAKATKAQEEEEEEAGGAEEGAAAGAAAAAPSTPQAAPQSKRARGEGAAAAGAEEEGKAAKDGAGAGGGGGDGDSDSAVTLDRAEQALADSMAPPAVEAAAATGAVAGGAADAGSDPADALRRHSVAQLRLELQRRGLPSSGVKATLVQRLAAAMAGDGAAAAPAAAAPAAAAPAPAAAAEAAEAEPEPQSPVAMAVAAVADEDSPALRTPVAQTTAPAAPMGPRKGPRPAEPQSVQTPTIAAGGVNGAASAAAAAVAAAAGLTAAATTPSTVEGPAAAPQAAAAATSLSSARSKYDITPGIQGLKMASAKDAAFEKLLAGENRAVEHVALEDDEVVDLLSAYPVPSTRKRARALQELEQQQQ
ncbi:hypothetical protein HXX76_011749 [Chlamydomonas incerta]|uniref:SAP domain-containing protein n=1 Tax=Chlamydomonas incerta TaxID=51695 RepID=A0A835VRH5_CHLIN|nr:hypothetical protein HXX76_011749 [Chlamydomonas incerta]|eukprot:KAG2426522.1 hypothetical protein HXX76_011749 [Chlamydomonas incerta]